MLSDKPAACVGILLFWRKRARPLKQSARPRLSICSVSASSIEQHLPAVGGYSLLAKSSVTRRVYSTIVLCGSYRFERYMRNSIIMATTIIVLCIALVPACVIAFGKYSGNIKNSDYIRSKLLENVINQLEKDIVKSEVDSKYVQFGRIKTTEHEPVIDTTDYEDEVDDTNIMPSIRDNEYIQHSTLWGAQYMSGGAGEGVQTLNPENPVRNKNEVKTDATLPAYCNPPNPCPVGYSEEDGCIIDFENTAAFSREYQELQECMCDSEHMFDCGRSNTGGTKHNVNVDELVRKFQVEDEHKNLVAKKFHVKKAFNPYLQGEFLPIAAKKGINIGF